LSECEVSIALWSTMTESHATLTILQWNILLDSDAPGCIDAQKRQYAEPEHLSWNYRCEKIAMRIQEYCADVLLLEELSASMFTDLCKKLPDFNGWHASELVKPFGEDVDPKVVESMEVGLFTHAQHVKVDGQPRCIPLYAGYDGDDKALLLYPPSFQAAPSSSYVVVSAALQHCSQPNAKIVVGATHLRWEFGTMPAAAAKPMQAEAAANAIIQHAHEVGAESWILAGDFNSPPESDAYHLLTHGSLAKSHPLHPSAAIHRDLVLQDGVSMQSVFALVNGSEPLFTRKKNKQTDQYCLDYIFIGGTLLCNTAAYSTSPLPYQGDGSDLPQLPCAAWPSDHLPLVVNICPPAKLFNEMCASGDSESVQIAFSANPNLAIKCDPVTHWTGLHAATKAGHAQIVHLCLEKKADVAACTHHESTALHIAACNARTEIARILVESGCPLEAVDNKKNTALLRSAQHGSTGVADVLIAAGADVNVQNVDGQSVADRAEAGGHQAVLERVSQDSRKRIRTVAQVF